jgi:UDP-glucose 4-epimerase
MKCLPTSFVDPEGAYMAGVQIALNLAYLLRKKRYTRLIHFSSSEVYGSAKTVPMTEEHPTNPTTPYAAGKLAADHLLLTYKSLHDLDIAILRPFNLLGPRQNWGPYAGVVPITICRLLRGKRPIIYGSGNQTRDFTYVKDVADVIPQVLSLGDIPPVNIASGKESTINYIVQAICRHFGEPANFDYQPERPCDVRRHYADISLARKLLKYEPKTSLEQAIAQTVEWYKHNA